MNSVDKRLWVVDIATSKTSKTFRDRYIKDLSLIKLPNSLDLERVYCLRKRCIPNILLALLEPGFSKVKGKEDLTAYWSLRSNRPCLSLAIHGSRDGSRVIVTEILIPIWILVFHSTPGRLRVIYVS